MHLAAQCNERLMNRILSHAHLAASMQHPSTPVCPVLYREPQLLYSGARIGGSPGPYMLCCSPIIRIFVVQGQGRPRKAVGAVSENSAVASEQATEERTRQQQLQKALQLVMRLEDALSSLSMNVVSVHVVLVSW